jgi:hypothetical protein
LGVSTTGSINLNDALLAPDGMVTEVIVAVSAVLRNTTVAELAESETTRPPGPVAIGFPTESSCSIVSVGEVVPAATFTEAFTKPNRSAAPKIATPFVGFAAVGSSLVLTLNELAG